MRRELKEVKDRMEEARGEWERLREDREHNHINLTDEDSDSDEKDDLQEDEIDDDGTRTIRLDESEAAELLDHKSENVPLSLHSSESKDNTKEMDSASNDEASRIATTQARLEQENTALSQRMEALSNELSAASQLSSSLKSQYVEAAETIHGLEIKVNSLEKALHSNRSEFQAPKQESQSTRKSAEVEAEKGSNRDDILREVESRFTSWKRSFEEAVQKERQGWEKEREELRVTLSEWEKRSESLKQNQSGSSMSNGGRRKRRSKASTVGTSSEESSDSGEDSPGEEGFVSPVTEEEAHSPPRDGNESSTAEGAAYPKRPRSRRRNYRSGEAAKAAKRAEAKAASRSVQEGNMSAIQSAGETNLRRRQSWIPFSRSFVGNAGGGGEGVDNAVDSEKKQQRRREASTVMEVSSSMLQEGAMRVLTELHDVQQHPALPIVSVAGVIVIGYLAYTAIMQQQK